MEYVIASLVAILAATLIVYKLANSIFGLSLRLRPLLLCAACAMFISLVLPKIVVGFAGLPGTIAVLAVFAIIFAYFVAKYEDEPSPTEVGENESACCLLVAQSQPDTIVQVGITSEVPNEIRNSNNDEKEISHITESENEYESALYEPSTSKVDDYYSVQTDIVVGNAHDYNSEGTTNISIIEETEELSINEQTTQITNNLPKEIHDDPVYLNLFELDNLVLVTDASTSGVAENCSTQAEVLLENTHDQNSEGITNISVTEELERLPINEQTAESTNNLPEEIGEIGLSSDLSELDNLGSVTNIVNVLEEPTFVEEREIPIEVVEELEIVDSTLRQNTKFEELLAEEIEVVQDSLNDTTVQEELMQKRPDTTFATSGVTVQEDENSIMPYNETAVEKILPESDQLDDLIDFAFSSKERHDYEAALTAFKQALTLYPYSEAAPFLVVEVGNLLKNKGAYDEAIEVFSDGRNLCQTREDEMMEQEFISTIAYLRIIKNVLLQHRLGCVRFLEIPQHIVKEIDDEFKEWRSVGNN
ncbi:tetratricopeptide repeat protein [Sporomusa malonica]|uniref:Uncharacterized protein n=1 Tax=Sporomusa malonica TaxID=112901 RepID=A0A1W2AQE3_9FIRM|nr:tetratricopeptide repeat protein [Sporomusa malonica]SMC62428.1 hypothetical protein SAMN04488500_1069 [Sporomusa malonica]